MQISKLGPPLLAVGAASVAGATAFLYHKWQEFQLQHLTGVGVANPNGSMPFYPSLEELSHRSRYIGDISYQLSFEISENTYSGTVLIRFFCLNREKLFLDWTGSEVSSVQVNSKPVAIHFTTHRVKIPAETLKVNTHNKVVIKFANSYSKLMMGLTKLSNQLSFNVYSQCEQNHTKDIFPCFDQIDLKATFQVEVVHQTSHLVFTNGVLVTEKAIEQTTQSRSTFSPTKSIPPYLFALSVGDYYVVRPKSVYLCDRKAAIIVRNLVLNQINEKETGEIFKVLEMTMRELEALTGLSWPSEKTELLFVPEFRFYAMENQGLIIFDEDKYLFKSAPSTITKSLRRAYILIHELCHYYFGNHTTISDYNNLWLKEGFATYFGYNTLGKIAPAVFSIYPETVVQFMRLSFNQILEVGWKHPIAHYLADQALYSIYEYYDSITYEKGAAFLHTLSNLMSDVEFKKMVKSYIAMNSISTEHFEQIAITSLMPGEQARTDRLRQCIEQMVHTCDTLFFETSWEQQLRKCLLSLKLHTVGDSLSSPQLLPMRFHILTKHSNGYSWKDVKMLVPVDQRQIQMEISLNQEAENVMVIIPMIPQFGYALFPLGNLTFLKEILNELNEYLLAQLHNQIFAHIWLTKNQQDLQIPTIEDKDLIHLLLTVYLELSKRLLSPVNPVDDKSFEINSSVVIVQQSLSQFTKMGLPLLSPGIQEQFIDALLNACASIDLNTNLGKIFLKNIHRVILNDTQRKKILELYAYGHNAGVNIKQKYRDEVNPPKNEFSQNQAIQFLNSLEGLTENEKPIKELQNEVLFACKAIENYQEASLNLAHIVINIFRIHSLIYSTSLFSQILKGLGQEKGRHLKGTIKSMLANSSSTDIGILILIRSLT